MTSSAITPLSKAAFPTQFLVFQHQTSSFAIELRLVQEVLTTIEQPITPVPNTAPMLLGLTNLRGEIVPVVDFGQFVGLEIVRLNSLESRILILENTQTSSSQTTARQNTIRFGVAVERVQGVVQFQAGKIEPSSNASPELIPYLRGLYDLNGQLLMVLSVATFANDSRW
ncbi:chemotaxis protein CheW [Leptolyngbya sp. FACHB-261]|uniref:chemotaxis protein CheW n=1 Tax=Leptolyngbya sp. FACHB-261 TaxID=2692806 RepID=UPI001681FDD3|nr:chemotaxis protein CheW [Leptolyngbya sp. FACHB-261]MBD2104024.1 chemotaxis protein CheW [Leptolyngbya sp. FACHB-261]